MLMCFDCIDDQCPDYGSDRQACDEYNSLIEKLDDEDTLRESEYNALEERCLEAEEELAELKEVVARFIKEVQGETL